VQGPRSLIHKVNIGENRIGGLDVRKRLRGVLKTAVVVLLAFDSIVFGQLSIEEARNATHKMRLGSYSYHEEFIGKQGYGAPVILTRDGGAAAFGGGEENGKACGLLVKMDTNANEAWRKAVFPQFDELETQSVIQDTNGNLYVFMLSYDGKRYRGGSERILCFDKDGGILWDKTLGAYTLMNNPVISYIHLDKNGKIALRGHVVKDKPVKGKDPVYRFWQGWINSKGELEQKTGDIIDWTNQDWKKLFAPE